MPIEQVTAFEYRGKVFTDEMKAIQFAESLVGEQIKADILGKGFTVAEWVRITETLIAHRETLSDLLSY